MFTHKNLSSSLVIALAASSILAMPTALAGNRSLDPYASETYGRASGDTPLPNLGLVLELVDGDTKRPKIRLFGGVPGNEATILISGAKTSEPGPSASTVLVAGDPIAVTGQFDWLGYFEVPLTRLPDRASGIDRLFAQGVHSGALGILGDAGSVFELSNGLELFPVPKEREQKLSLDDLKPSLPENRSPDMFEAQGLEEKLRVALNSEGDEVTVQLKANMSIAVVVAVNVGGEYGLEAKVTRIEGGRYEVAIGADVMAQAGVEACEGIEAKAGAGYGGSRIFRFESISGVARGLKGLAFALRFPNFQPARFAAEHGAIDALKERIEILAQRQRETRQRLTELEDALWNVWERRLEMAHGRMLNARSVYQRTKAAFQQARVRTPAMWANLGRRYAAYRAALAVYNVASTAHRTAQNAVELARQVAERAREELRHVMDGLAVVGRMAAAIGQTVTFAKDHYSGSEFRLASGAEAEAVLGIPGVTLSNVGAGIETELKQTLSVRTRKKTEHKPRGITITRQIEQRAKMFGGYAYGAEYEAKRSIALVDAFDFPKGEAPRWAEHSATFTRDDRMAGVVGALVTATKGLGRTHQFWTDQDEMLKNKAKVLALLVDDGAGSALGAMGTREVGFSIQDRRQDSIGFGIGISYVGYGGGIEGSIEWADRGDKLEKSITLKKAVKQIIDKVDG